MRLIDRYIYRTIIYASLLVFVIFVGLRLFVGIFGELGSLGEGQYNILQALQYVTYTMPLNIYQLYPSIALLGVLTGLGMLASTHELTIIRASGISIAQIAWKVFKIMVLITILMTIVGEVIAPKLDEYAEKRKLIAQHGSVIEGFQSGLWLKEGRSFIYIGSSMPGSQLEDITRFSFDNNHQLASASYAERADFKDNQWHFYNVHTTLFYPEHVSTKIEAEITWPLSFKPHLLTLIDPNQMTLLRLLQQSEYSKSNGLDASDYELTFWMRVLQPLATLVMVFLAIPFVFGPLRSSTMGLRILSGVMVGLSFYIINRLFGPFSIVYQIPPVIAAATPIFLFFILALVLMWRRV